MGAEVAHGPVPVARTRGPGGGEPPGRWSAWRRRMSRHPGWCLLAAGVATAALWFSHMPSLLLHAQFYADDGGWYQAAYSRGPVLPLLQPDAGYLVLLQRVGASLSLLLPLVAVPTFFNVVALLVEVGGICYLLSQRMAAAIPSAWARVAIAVLVVALPNAYDTSGNLTNAQWHLALIAFLVVFAGPPRRVWGWIVDGLILIVSGLTGPYCLILEPIAAWRWLRDRPDRRALWVLAANSACVLAQLSVILISLGTQRMSSPLGAGVVPLVTMLGRQVTLGLLAGARGLGSLSGTPLASNPVILGVLAAMPVAACAWAAWRGPAILRGFCVFAALELGLALASPSINAPRWPNLGRPASLVNFHPGGIRYFLYPLLAFAISLGWLVARGARRSRARRSGAGLPGMQAAAVRLAGVGAALLLLLATVVGSPLDWVYPSYLNQHWAAEVQRLEVAPPGTRVVIPINPRGWTVTLVAR